MAADSHVYASRINEALRRRLEQETHRHTQAQIAAALGVGQTPVARMINDGSNWTMRQLTAFAALRGETPSSLLRECQADFADTEARHLRVATVPARKGQRYLRRTDRTAEI
jgi:hypothetical protein